MPKLMVLLTFHRRKRFEPNPAFYQKVFDAQVCTRGVISCRCKPGTNDIIVFERKKADYGMRVALPFGFRLRHPKDIDKIVDSIKSAGGKNYRQRKIGRVHPIYF